MSESTARVIRTPDQRLRVFVSSTLQEVADERRAVREAIEQLRLAPVMFESARGRIRRKSCTALPRSKLHLHRHLPEKYGWVAPDMDISGLKMNKLIER